MAPGGRYTNANIKGLTKWSITSIWRNDASVKACTIEVEEAYTYNDNGTIKLSTVIQGGDIVSLTTVATANSKICCFCEE